MENFLEKPNDAVGGWPLCPFAKKARISDKMYISFIDWDNFNKEINKSLPMLEHKDIAVLMFEVNEINSDQLMDYIYYVNQMLMQKNYVLIADHPMYKEELNGVNIHFGEYGLILIFKLDKLNQLALHLKEKGYFKFWPKERIKQNINWRFKNEDLSE